MSAAIRTFIVLLCTLPVVAYLGAELGNEEFVMPIVVCVFLVGLAFNRLCLTHLRYEAFVLSVLLFGYIVGNRGFAAISPTASFPLYLGEIGMVACLLSAAAQIALKRSDLIPNHPLGVPILVFLLYGGIRLVFDVSTYRMDAVRDSALVYYAAFFYIAYNVGLHERSRHFLEKALLFSLFVLIPTLLLVQIVPGIFDSLAIRGMPIIAHKGDLAGIFLSVGMFYFYLLAERSRARGLMRMIAMVCFVMMVVAMIRAAYVGVAVGLALVVAARRPGLLAWQGVSAAVGLLLIGVIAVGGSAGDDSILPHLEDKLTSIVDLSGTGSYQVQTMSAANNQFRMVWWQTVFAETTEQHPWLGLGFGYDLTERFLRTYWALGTGGDPNIRSPHSYPVTVFGRMGIIGSLMLLWITVLIFREAWRSARAYARDEIGPWPFAHWVAAVTIFVSAAFGVVLEGPMGGIVFWTVLGIACSYSAKPTVAPVPMLDVEEEMPPKTHSRSGLAPAGMSGRG